MYHIAGAMVQHCIQVRKSEFGIATNGFTIHSKMHMLVQREVSSTRHAAQCKFVLLTSMLIEAQKLRHLIRYHLILR